MQARPNAEFLYELREKLDPELTMRVDDETNEVVVWEPEGKREIARVSLGSLQMRAKEHVVPDPGRSEIWNYREVKNELERQRFAWGIHGFEQTVLRRGDDLWVAAYTKQVEDLEELLKDIYRCEHSALRVELRDHATEPLSEEFVEALESRLGDRFALSATRCHLDVTDRSPHKGAFAGLSEEPLRIAVRPGVIADTSGNEPQRHPEVQEKARRILAELAGAWEARGYSGKFGRRSYCGGWAGRFGKRVGSLEELVDEVLFAAEQEMVVVLEDWGMPPPSAELVAAFTEALSSTCDVYLADRRLVVRHKKSGHSVTVVERPLRIESHVLLDDVGPGCWWHLYTETTFPDGSPSWPARGHQAKRMYDHDMLDPPLCRVGRQMKSVPAAIEEARWLLEHDVPLRW